MENIKDRYDKSKRAKVGDKCICPSCLTEFIKTNYQQAFCKSKPKTICKDKYWNTVIPEKRCNTSRISPASARWMQQQKEKYKEYDDHPFSSEALGQW